MKKNPFIFTLVIALCASCVFTSCNTDSENSDRDSYSKETIEQLNKFEPGWWNVYVTRKKVNDITGEETDVIAHEEFWYLINYDSNGKATGDYFGEFEQHNGEFKKVYWKDDDYYESDFQAMNYKVACKYIEEYIEDKHIYNREEGYTYYKKFKLEKVNFEDEEANIPSWLEE